MSVMTNANLTVQQCDLLFLLNNLWESSKTLPTKSSSASLDSEQNISYDAYRVRLSIPQKIGVKEL